MEFTLGVPAIGENFIDREEHLSLILSVAEEAIQGRAQNSVAFLGPMGIGKTSLLLEGARRIKARYGEQAIAIVIFGAEISNEMHFLEKVRNQLSIPQKRFVQWQDLGEYIFEHVANHIEKLVILMIDDFDELTYKRKNLIHFLRKQYQSLKNLLLFMTLSSRAKQIDKIFGYKEAFHGQLLIKTIGELPLAEANHLIDKLSSGRFSEPVKDEIIALSESEPFLIQLLCKGSEREAEVQGILAETLAFSSPFFKEVWKDLSSQQRAILQEMEQKDSAATPTEIALKISVEPKNIITQFQRLMDLRIVKKTDGRYMLKPLLKEWLTFRQKQTRSERFTMTSKQIFERLNELIPQYQLYRDEELEDKSIPFAKTYEIEDEIIQLAKTYIEVRLRFYNLQDKDEVLQTALFNLWEQFNRGNISFLSSTFLNNLVRNAVVQMIRRPKPPSPVGLDGTPPDESETAEAKEAYAALVRESLQRTTRPDERLEEAEDFDSFQRAWFDPNASARILYVTLRSFSGAQFKDIAEELGVNASNVLPRGKKARQVAFDSLRWMLDLWKKKQDMCVCFMLVAYRTLWKKGKPNSEAGMDEGKIKKILWKLFYLASEYGIEERNSLYQMQFPPHGCIIEEEGYWMSLTIGYIGDILPQGGVIEISDQETITVHEIRVES